MCNFILSVKFETLKIEAHPGNRMSLNNIAHLLNFNIYLLSMLTFDMLIVDLNNWFGFRLARI